MTIARCLVDRSKCQWEVDFADGPATGRPAIAAGPVDSEVLHRMPCTAGAAPLFTGRESSEVVSLIETETARGRSYSAGWAPHGNSIPPAADRRAVLA